MELSRGRGKLLKFRAVAYVCHSLLPCLTPTQAGVAELADAGDSKSPGPCALAGSTPASGTNEIKRLGNLLVEVGRG